MNRKYSILLSSVFFVFFFTYTTALAGHTQNSYKSKVIILDGWAELEYPNPLQEIPDLYDRDSQEIQKKKVSQASQHIRAMTFEILSGMIYGYTFSYTPGDKARTVKEKFTLTLIGFVSSDDSNFSVVTADVHDASLFVLSRYNLSDAQIRRVDLWNNATSYPSDGTGTAIVRNSLVDSKIDALYDAIRDGVRRRLRLQLANKPKEVKGSVRISKNPLFIRSGQSYISKTTIDIMVSNAERYDSF